MAIRLMQSMFRNLEVSVAPTMNGLVPGLQVSIYNRVLPKLLPEERGFLNAAMHCLEERRAILEFCNLDSIPLDPGYSKETGLIAASHYGVTSEAGFLNL
jgi:hypothetical protein